MGMMLVGMVGQLSLPLPPILVVLFVADGLIQSIFVPMVILVVLIVAGGVIRVLIGLFTVGIVMVGETFAQQVILVVLIVVEVTIVLPQLFVQEDIPVVQILVGMVGLAMLLLLLIPAVLVFVVAELGQFPIAMQVLPVVQILVGPVG